MNAKISIALFFGLSSYLQADVIVQNYTDEPVKFSFTWVGLRQYERGGKLVESAQWAQEIEPGYSLGKKGDSENAKKEFAIKTLNKATGKWEEARVEKVKNLLESLGNYFVKVTKDKSGTFQIGLEKFDSVPEKAYKYQKVTLPEKTEASVKKEKPAAK